MPTPIGHGLAGIAAGWAVARPAATRRSLEIQSAILATLGAAADLDLVVGTHRGPSHSVGAAAIAATAVVLLKLPLARSRGRAWWAAFAAWATHPLLDALAVDTSIPIGVMAFWPFSDAYGQTGWAVFLPVFRRWWVAGFMRHTTVALLRELAILVPIVYLVWRWRRARPGIGYSAP